VCPVPLPALIPPLSSSMRGEEDLVGEGALLELRHAHRQAPAWEHC